jgi:hypothetical protein
MNERLQPERLEPQKPVPESVPLSMIHEVEAPEVIKSEKIGKYLYCTESSGRITIFDETGSEELSLLKMTPEARKVFFDMLYTEALAALPPGTVVEPESPHSGSLSLSVFTPDLLTGDPMPLGDIGLVSLHDELEITSIDANTKGVTRLLMARALQEFPNTKYIVGTLHRSYVGFNRFQSRTNDEPKPEHLSRYRSDPAGTKY